MTKLTKGVSFAGTEASNGGGRRRTKTDGDLIPTKPGGGGRRVSKRKERKKSMTINTSCPASATNPPLTLITATQQRQNLRRMSVDFMSAEVARMTLTANAGLGVPKSGSKKKAPANLARRASQASESNDVLVRRTLVHRAIKRMRSEARTAGRAWLTNTLKRGDSVEGAEFVDKDEGGERVDDMIAAAAGGEGEDTPQGDAPKSVMGVAVRILAVSSAYKKLKRVAAKSSWYSEYQEQHNYEHRVQKDGFQFIVEYKAHFGNVVKSFFPTIPLTHQSSHSRAPQLAFISLDKTGFNLWEVIAAPASTVTGPAAPGAATTWLPPLTRKRVAFKRRQNSFIQALCYVPKHQMYVGAGLDMLAHIYDKNMNFVVALPTGERVIRHIIYNEELDEIIIAGTGGCKAWKLDRRIAEEGFVFNLVVVRCYTTEKKGGESWVTHVEFDGDCQRIILLENECVRCINCRNGNLMSVLSNIHTAPLTGCVWYNRSQYFITSCAQGLVKVWAMHNNSTMEFGSHDYALLHVFTGHTKTVTALQLHPLSGLAVSVSLDGTLRVLNLEALEEIYVLQIMQPLVAMKCVRVTMQEGEAPISLCVGATQDGTVRVWSINDFLGFYNVCRAVCEDAVQVYDKQVNEAGTMNAVVIAGEDIRVFDEKGRLISNMMPGQLTGYILGTTYSMPHEILFIMHGSRGVQKISVFDCRETPCVELCVVGDPATVVEHDISTAMAVVNGKVAVLEEYLAGKGRAAHARKGRSRDTVKTPTSPVMKEKDRARVDVGFRFSDDEISDQMLLFGTRTGSIIFTRPGPKMKIVSTFKDSHEGKIISMSFNETLGKLVTFGINVEQAKCEMKVWSFPSMKLVFTLPLRGSPTATAVSNSLPFVALGFKDGMVQLIEIVGNQPIEVDNPHTLEQHIDSVVSLSFCDEFQVYCSASADQSIKVWDFGNRLLDRVLLNKVPGVCFFNGKQGDIVISQGNYLLKVCKATWLPPGAQEALEDRQQKEAVMKIQAKLRGNSIRRVLGSGIQTKPMAFFSGDEEGEGATMGIDGKYHRERSHRGRQIIARAESSFDEDWASKLNAEGSRTGLGGLAAGTAAAGRSRRASDLSDHAEEEEEEEEWGRSGSDCDGSEDSFFAIDPTRPSEGRGGGRGRGRGGVVPIGKECANEVLRFGSKTIEARLEGMAPPLAGPAMRYSQSLKTSKAGMTGGGETFVSERALIDSAGSGWGRGRLRKLSNLSEGEKEREEVSEFCGG